MPELPEVETIKRQLEQKIKGLTIKKVEVKKAQLFKGDTKKLSNIKIIDVRRRAKMIIIDLEKDLHLLIHLKMTGQLIFVDPTSPRLRGAGKYTYIVFYFSDGSVLYYNDIRQFGWIKLLTTQELANELAGFGPEPLEKSFTLEKFKENILKRGKAKIKPALMDQAVVAGIGNIYASEICFLAKIMPTRVVSTLTNEEIKKLYEAIKKVLPLAIKYKGTSAENYVTLEGKQGEYQSKLWVYGRTGEPCPKKCGGKVKKMMLAGRGTFYCEKCQK